MLLANSGPGELWVPQESYTLHPEMHLQEALPYLIEQDYSAYTADQHAVWAELVQEAHAAASPTLAGSIWKASSRSAYARIGFRT